MQTVSLHGDVLNEPRDTEVLTNLITKLFRKEIVTAPELYTEGKDIESHLAEVTRYLRLCNVTNETEMSNILMRSLSTRTANLVRMDYDFDDNKNDFEWMKGKLTELFKEKISESSPIVKMLQIKQGLNQSVVDFAREIKIEAANCIRHLSKERREICMLKTFLKGLRNRDLATSLQLLNPEKLDDAVNLIKHEKITETSNDICVVNDSKDDQIRILINRINQLERRMMVLEKQKGHIPSNNNYAWRNFKRPTERNTNDYPSFKAPGTGCFQCGSMNHYARECPQRKCNRCGKPGHIERNCRVWTKPKRVNALDIESKPESIGVPNFHNRFQYLEDEMESNAPVNIPESDEVFCVNQTVIPHRPKRPSNIDKIVNYVNGYGNMPKCIKPKSHQETNKPVVLARYNGVRGKTLMDTGATINLISKQFLDEIEAQSFKVQLKRGSSKSIRCANGSVMKCHGEAIINFSMGGINCQENFHVVEDFVKNIDAIVGIRSMKKYGMNLSLEDDCIIY